MLLIFLIACVVCIIPNIGSLLDDGLERLLYIEGDWFNFETKPRNSEEKPTKSDTTFDESDLELIQDKPKNEASYSEPIIEDDYVKQAKSTLDDLYGA